MKNYLNALPEGSYTRAEIIGGCLMIQADCMAGLPNLPKVDAVVTDPPYGMSFQSNHRTKKHIKIANDESPELAVNAINWAILFDIACKRVKDAYAQPDMFRQSEAPTLMIQEAFL